MSVFHLVQNGFLLIVGLSLGLASATAFNLSLVVTSKRGLPGAECLTIEQFGRTNDTHGGYDHGLALARELQLSPPVVYPEAQSPGHTKQAGFQYLSAEFFGMINLQYVLASRLGVRTVLRVTQSRRRSGSLSLLRKTPWGSKSIER